MKKVIRAAGYLLLSCLLVLVIGYEFPAYRSGSRSLIFLLILDGYLWTAVGPVLKSRGAPSGFFWGTLYWIPLLLILFSTAYGFVMPFRDWNIPFRSWVINLIGAGYIAKLIPSAFLLILDLVRMVKRMLYGRGAGHGFRPARPNRFLRAGWIASCVILLGYFYGIVIGSYSFRVREEKIALKDLPESFRGTRIVQISDLHLGSWSNKKKLSKAVGMVRDLHPDMIFITGDLMNYTSRDAEGFLDILGRLKAPEGVFIVNGNHDYGLYVALRIPDEVQENMQEHERNCERLGWDLLRNDHALIIRGRDTLAVLGIENWGKARRFPKYAKLFRAEQGVESIKTQLLLSHDPDFWATHVIGHYPQIDVTFSGHTHGGQIGMETASCRFSAMSRKHKEWAGMYDTLNSLGQHQYLYVNRGLGTILYAGRIGIWPEITLFTLDKAD